MGIAVWRASEASDTGLPEMLRVVRSSYGLCGVVYEVTLRIKPLEAIRYRGRDAHCWAPTGSPEAVTRLRLPQNVACGFTALRSSTADSQHLRCYLFKLRFHGRLIFSLNRRPCLPLNGAHVAQEQFSYR